VYTDSVNLDNVEQEDLLRSDEFFDVARHPTMHFASTEVAREAAGRLSVTGDLTIRGITRRLTVPIRVMPAGSAPGTTTFDTTFQIDRTQFGLTGGGPRSREFKVSIGKNVTIHMAIAAPQGPAGGDALTGLTVASEPMIRTCRSGHSHVRETRWSPNYRSRRHGLGRGTASEPEIERRQ
jgi:hypothetical protein